MRRSELVSLAATKPHLIVLCSLTKFYAMPVFALAMWSAPQGGGKVESRSTLGRINGRAGSGRVALDEVEFDVESRRANAVGRENSQARCAVSA